MSRAKPSAADASTTAAGPDLLKLNRRASLLTLLTSSSTLICCALPALLVTLGAGAALSSLISSVPQLVWLSEYKLLLFSLAGSMMLLAGLLQWRARSAPCPADPALAAACTRARLQAWWIYLLSWAVLLVGIWFAFIAPLLME
ncbi:hypothetical protein [Methylobacillus flagellatus]|uniref:hypothetical protein n=1 Tax=Methylobacillus flagellatus TaxID=405 RepID=UPI0010F4F4C0|nr:hypothetical protein [Methylobacillus flagellatus]